MSKKSGSGNKTVFVTNGASVPSMVKKGASTPAKPKPAPKPQSK